MTSTELMPASCIISSHPFICTMFSHHSSVTSPAHSRPSNGQACRSWSSRLSCNTTTLTRQLTMTPAASQAFVAMAYRVRHGVDSKFTKLGGSSGPKFQRWGGVRLQGGIADHCPPALAVLLLQSEYMLSWLLATQSGCLPLIFHVSVGHYRSSALLL